MSNKIVKIENQIVTIGQEVGFKLDIETYGKIKDIKGSNVVVEYWADNDHDDEYKTAIIHKSKCWID